ncbi:MAG: [FeFe] hydrogenase H-cluster maturation GTPase HydF [Kiritimatiellae bacterium]|nr:[FeFe] hydrogenase H-cluster maturation GTPase HydF [Kiritimatiellia bacterium]
MNDTPKANRIHIAIFGYRNAGKSTLINALTGQNLAIVNEKSGTTTDPVSKAMEILPLGPCLVTDTAGLDDDEGELGAQRVAKSLDVLSTTDVAIWVGAEIDPKFSSVCAARKIKVLQYQRGDSVEDLKRRIAALDIVESTRPLVADLVEKGDLAVCVCPIDSSAPKGRLILPQQQIIREILDFGATAIVCREKELAETLSRIPRPKLVITDSQAFRVVRDIVPENLPLTSFSILFARAKGDLAEFRRGAQKIAALRDGDRILVSEGCTHHRQCEDIGTVKLPKWLESKTGRKLEFEFTSGGSFPADLSKYALVVHCGGCTLTRRQVMERVNRCKAAGVPIVNYGLAIAFCNNVEVGFPAS